MSTDWGKIALIGGGGLAAAYLITRSGEPFVLPFYGGGGASSPDTSSEGDGGLAAFVAKFTAAIDAQGKMISDALGRVRPGGGNGGGAETPPPPPAIIEWSEATPDQRTAAGDLYDRGRQPNVYVRPDAAELIRRQRRFEAPVERAVYSPKVYAELATLGTLPGGALDKSDPVLQRLANAGNRAGGGAVQNFKEQLKGFLERRAAARSRQEFLTGGSPGWQAARSKIQAAFAPDPNE